jgi:hypothetical protein
MRKAQSRDVTPPDLVGLSSTSEVPVRNLAVQSLSPTSSPPPPQHTSGTIFVCSFTYLIININLCVRLYIYLIILCIQVCS